MLNKSKGKTMQTKTIADEAFEMTKTIQNVSRSGNLYGQLFAIQDMRIHLLEEEKRIREEIEREEKQ